MITTDYLEVDARIAKLEAENAALKAEKDGFYTDYRMACDKGEKDATMRLLAAQLRIKELEALMIRMRDKGDGEYWSQMNECLSTRDNTAEIDALVRDAERYRWLREDSVKVDDTLPGVEDPIEHARRHT